MSSTELPGDAEGLLQQLQQTTAALAALPVEARCGEPAERIEALSRLRAQLDAQLLAELRSFEDRGGHIAAGCKTIGAWTRLHLRQTPTRAGATVGTARALGSLPAVADALAQGSISLEHAEAIVAGARRIGAAEIARHEDTLVALARSASPAEVRAAVSEIIALVEADSDSDAGSAAARAEAKAARAEASRCFASRRVGDQVVFNGAVDLATGEALVSYIDAHAKPTPGPDGSRDERTAAQRRADAFTRLVETAVDAPTGAGGMPERVRSTAAIILTLSIETLQRLHGTDALLERLGAIPSPTARRLLCDGTLTRIICDPSGEPIDITTCGRAHTTGQAKALALLHTTCAFPGCAVPFRRCHIHHITHWIDGGPTELANLVPLCGTHHRFHHEGGYTITTTTGRTLTFRDPSGRVIPNPDAALSNTTDQLRLHFPAYTTPPSPSGAPMPTGPTRTSAPDATRDLGTNGRPRHRQWPDFPEPPPQHNHVNTPSRE